MKPTTAQPPKQALRRGMCPSLAAIFLLLTTTAGNARSLGSTTPDGASLAVGCEGCHGADGHGQGTLPNLQKLDKVEFLARMKAFQNPEFQHSLMHRIASSYSAKEWEAIFEFFQTAHEP